MLRLLSIGFMVLTLTLACNNSFMGPGGNGTSTTGEVLIRIANPDGRTIMPVAPQFNHYVLSLEKENGDTITVPNTTGIDGAGITVNVPEGTWTVRLEAYQDIFDDGIGILAAEGNEVLTIYPEQSSYSVIITLSPIPISSTAPDGLFSFNITLPAGVDTATLSLKDGLDNVVDGFEAFDLMKFNVGSIALSPGYYDLSIILMRNGQTAGLFESVHVYSGLESAAKLNLNSISFTNRVYLAGTLTGIRLGTIRITSDAAGTDIIKEINLDERKAVAVRNVGWVLDIPATYIGKTVYIIQEFNGEKVIVPIFNLAATGVDNAALNLVPTVSAQFNIASWYSTLTASGGAGLALVADGESAAYWESERDDYGKVWLELDFGFDVSVNASRLAFHSETGSVFLSGYAVMYWDGSAWVQVFNRSQYFTGSTDGSVFYNDFFSLITAQKFRWEVTALDGDAPGVIEFGLYRAASRSNLLTRIDAAEQNITTTAVSIDGTDVDIDWVPSAVEQTFRTAINAAKAAANDLLKTQDEIDKALNDLNGAIDTFNKAKNPGTSTWARVNQLSYQDGFADRFVIHWDNEPQKRYIVRTSTSGLAGTWENIAEFPITDDRDPKIETYIFEADPGMTRHFEVQAYGISGLPGESRESGPLMTLGIPELSLVSGDPSYRTVPLRWNRVEKADTYRIVYSFAGDSTSPHSMDVKINDLTSDGAGVYTYSFTPKEYNDPILAGREMEISLRALNMALWQEVGGDIEHYSTSSYPSHSPIKARLVGPGDLNALASQAAFADSITLSWDAVSGAGGYYVFRRQFNINNINNNTEESGVVVFYVPAVESASITVTGKNIAASGDTMVTKAGGSFANNRFTLTDSWMTDNEYNGSFSTYTSQYKNQQNDMVQGYPYRYIVVPVLAGHTVSNFSASATTLTYSIGGINYTNAIALEQTGYTVGFAANVTATKGTYASSGNVNDGIRVTWSKPALLADKDLSYMVYRRVHNGDWELAHGPTGELSYVDKPASGILYEYAVGIRHHLNETSIIGPTQPYTSSRFIDWSRTQLDGKDIPKPKFQGYILPMVSINRPSRNERKVGDNFAIEVTWSSGGIANSNGYANWGIDGYDVFVMNRNVDGNWHRIADQKNNQNLSVEVTNVQGGDTLQGGLLKVLRDYRQYFKVRSYVKDGDDKIYSPDPDWNYETLFSQTANRTNQDRADFLETAHVKWGARQITHTELVRATSIVLAWGIDASSWQTTVGGATEKTNGNNGSSGEVYRESSSGIGWWWYDFRNYKPDMDTNANRNNWTYSVTFLTVHTNSNMSGNADQRTRTIVAETSGAGGRPRFYGALENYRTGLGTRYNYGTGFFNVNGPSNLNGLYSAQMRFWNDNTSSQSDSARSRRFQLGNADPGDGYIEVRYPTSAATTVKVRGGKENTALMFSGENSNNSRRGLWY